MDFIEKESNKLAKNRKTKLIKTLMPTVLFILAIIALIVGINTIANIFLSS